MRYVTLLDLKKTKACKSQVLLFKKTFGARVAITRENILKARKVGLDVGFALEYIRKVGEELNYDPYKPNTLPETNIQFKPGDYVKVKVEATDGSQRRTSPCFTIRMFIYFLVNPDRVYIVGSINSVKGWVGLRGTEYIYIPKWLTLVK